MRRTAAEIVGPAVELQPALAFDEPQEHHAVEERLRKHPQILILEPAFLADLPLDLLEDRRVVVIEPLGDLFDVKRLGPCGYPAVGVRIPFRPSQRGEIELAEGPARAFVAPTEGRQGRGPRRSGRRLK